MLWPWLLVPFSVITSIVAAIFGLGGGLLLISVMPFLLPASAVVPIHSITQLASNAARAGFACQAVQWRFMLPFLIGSFLGVAVFALLWANMPARWIPLCIGVYILSTLWSRRIAGLLKRFESFYSAGFFQSGLGIVVGATGPLTLTLLAKQLNERDQIVATSAMMMLFTHVLKTIAFVIVGFPYLAYLDLLIALVIAAIVGSWLGTKLRKRIDDIHFRKVLNLVLSVLAAGMIGKSIWG